MKRNFLFTRWLRAGTITALLFFAGFPVALDACDICGAYAGIMPFDNQNSFAVAHRYRVFNGYPAMNQGTSLFPAGAYRLAQPGSYSPLHGSHDPDIMQPSDYESFKVIEARTRYFLHPRVEVNLVIPFVQNKQKALGKKTEVFGLGDIIFFTGFHAIRKLDSEKFRHRLIIGLGIKLPTGSCNSTYPDGDRLPVMLQRGTGSVDGFAFVTYSGALKNWRYGITALGKYSGMNNYDEQIRPSTVSTAFGAYQFQKNDWLFLPQVQLYQEFTQGLEIGTYLYPGTGMNMLLGGPGVEIYRKKIGFSVCYQFPLWQDVHELNMQTAGRLSAGLSYNFGGKYLFD